jgi:hypothetical protein
MFLFFLGILNIFRHLYFLTQTIIINKMSSDEVETVKYRLNEKSLLFLGLSISYVLTIIVNLMY